jgi:5-keto 4-deoxyuronate isomerase
MRIRHSTHPAQCRDSNTAIARFDEVDIRKFVHSDGIRSSQLVLGVTSLASGRCYLYFDLPEDHQIVHSWCATKKP